jgi:CO dehydrogenase maturation factor
MSQHPALQLNYELEKILLNKRILICGKGGSGKSTLITLISRDLVKREYPVVLLDCDGSNPCGLTKMLFGGNDLPRPLIDFFGGRSRVECPSDNPSPLTRIMDQIPLKEKPISINEIPEEYYLEKNNLLLLQTGKINEPYEGCDGPMSKIARDFIVEDEVVTLIDVEAGIEHYGRGIEQNIDIVLICADPTFESISLADKVTKMCQNMNIKNAWIILNKVNSPETENYLRTELSKLNTKILGTVNYHQELFLSSLKGTPVKNPDAQKDIAVIISRMCDSLNKQLN